jgi:hypothetical protein
MITNDTKARSLLADACEAAGYSIAAQSIRKQMWADLPARVALTAIEKALATQPQASPAGGGAMSAEEHRLEDAKQFAAYVGPVISFDVTEPYYLASCDHCGWVGSTEHCSSDEDNDVFCPRCHHSGVDCGMVAERIGAQPPAGDREAVALHMAAKFLLRCYDNGPAVLHEKGGWETLRAALRTPSAPAVVGDNQVRHMVNRFLMWKLPETFNPDGGISFTPQINQTTGKPYEGTPSGTNLLDAVQAEAMVRHMVEGAQPPAIEPGAGVAQKLQGSTLHSIRGDKEKLAIIDRVAEAIYGQVFDDVLGTEETIEREMYRLAALAGLTAGVDAWMALSSPAIEPGGVVQADREKLAWDWLDDAFGTEGAVEDRTYSADEMVDAFIAGRVRPSQSPAPASSDLHVDNVATPCTEDRRVHSAGRPEGDSLPTSATSEIWRPAEHAPMGVDLLVWRSPKGAAPESYGYHAIASRDDDGWYDSDGREIVSPTHWADLPDMPASPAPAFGDVP